MTTTKIRIGAEPGGDAPVIDTIAVDRLEAVALAVQEFADRHAGVYCVAALEPLGMRLTMVFRLKKMSRIVSWVQVARTMPDIVQDTLTRMHEEMTR